MGPDSIDAIGVERLAVDVRAGSQMAHRLGTEPRERVRETTTIHDVDIGTPRRAGGIADLRNIEIRGLVPRCAQCRDQRRADEARAARDDHPGHLDWSMDGRAGTILPSAMARIVLS